jgi:hypothetical protein
VVTRPLRRASRFDWPQMGGRKLDLHPFLPHSIPCYHKTRGTHRSRPTPGKLAPSKLERGFSHVADTKKVEDKIERKKVKRTARKKAAPKAKRTTPRGANKKKIKKLVRGQSKR